MLSIEYVAGFFDGEGTVGIQRTRGKCYFFIEIAQVSRPVLFSLKTQFGGSVRIEKRKPPRSDIGKWRLYGEAALHLVDAMVPFLQVKRQQISKMRHRLPSDGVTGYRIKATV